MDYKEVKHKRARIEQLTREAERISAQLPPTTTPKQTSITTAPQLPELCGRRVNHASARLKTSL